MTFPDHGNDAGGPRGHAFPPDVEEIVGAAWREAIEITYEDYCIHLGNDGPSETDRVLPLADRQRQQAAIALIAEQTGISAGFIRSELLEAAYAEGQVTGTDSDPVYLAPPDWEDLAARWREFESTAEARRQEAASWRQLRGTPWDEQDPQSHLTISESTFVAASPAVPERSGIDAGPTRPPQTPASGVATFPCSRVSCPQSAHPVPPQRYAAPAPLSTRVVHPGQDRAGQPHRRARYLSTEITVCGVLCVCGGESRAERTGESVGLFWARSHSA